MGRVDQSFVRPRRGAAADFETLRAHVREKRGGRWAPKSIDFGEAKLARRGVTDASH
jgi:hypothetical protein